MASKPRPGQRAAALVIPFIKALPAMVYITGAGIHFWTVWITYHEISPDQAAIGFILPGLSWLMLLWWKVQQGQILDAYVVSLAAWAFLALLLHHLRERGRELFQEEMKQSE